MPFIHNLTLPSGSEYNLEGTLYTVIGTQNSSTASWTGASDLVALKSGVTIGYYLPYDSAANATLNLTLKDGTTTGAISVTGGDTAKAGNVVVLTYYNNSWICNGSFPYEIVTSISSSSDNTQIPTAKAVYDAIDALPEPMVFKGTVGDAAQSPTVLWSNLPAASSSNIGYTYKVVSAHASAPVCIVGDIITSNGSDWVVIPSGDDPGAVDTWRNILVNGTEKLGTAINTGALDFIDGTNTSVSFNSTGNKIAINATDTTYTATSGSVGSASNWSAGSAATLGTAIDADDITSWTTNTPTSFRVANEVLTITGGTAATLSYTAKSIPNVTDAGTAPSLTITPTSVVTSVTAN